MSSEYVQLVRRGYEAVGAGDMSLIAELLDPEVKWHGGDPDSGCRNRAEALEFMQRAHQRGMGRLVDVIDAGERVVVVMQPPPVEGEPQPLRANLTTFRNGLVVEMIAYDSPEAACAAAGLTAA